MTSVAGRFSEFCIRKILSKPTFSTLPMLRISRIEAVGMIAGISTLRMSCQRPAPSIFAASYREVSTPARAAR